MFLHLSVSLSVHGEWCMCGKGGVCGKEGMCCERGVCVAKGVHGEGACVAKGPCARQRGVCGKGGCAWQKGACIARQHVCSGRFKGGAREVRPPPRCPNSFNFMQFLGNFGKIVCWRPPGELAPPPRGNPGSATGMAGAVHGKGGHACRKDRH